MRLAGLVQWPNSSQSGLMEIGEEVAESYKSARVVGSAIRITVIHAQEMTEALDGHFLRTLPERELLPLR